MPSSSEKNINYIQESKRKQVLYLQNRVANLPGFMKEFFRGMEDQTTLLTRLGYAYDFSLFFTFLSDNIDKFEKKLLIDFTLNDLTAINADDIERFMEFLTYYIRKREGLRIHVQNEDQGKSRKLAAVRSMLLYFYKKGSIPSNPGERVDFPKIKEKSITRLEIDEAARLLDEVDSGEKLTDKQREYHLRTRTRDLALITLLLGTGIRVSECVGIDVGHLDFDICGLKVVRKGGGEAIIYFNSEVEETLADYISERMEITPLPGHENALFLSLQNRRITVRAVQNLVNKYSRLVTTLKNISPHKLRSTFGTNLYMETGDIYLVAEMLGHSDVNTTRKHYAASEVDRQRRAAQQIRLRE